MIKLIPFFPIPFLVCLFILGAAMWRSRRRGWLYLLGLALFGVYLQIILYVMFFPIPFPANWPHNLSRSGMLESLSRINWIPFNYHIGGGLRADIRSGFSDVVINVLLTIPIGIGLVLLFRPHWFIVLSEAAAVGLIFEGTQLFFKVFLGVYYHSVDMSDVVTNATGVLIGAVAAWIFLVIIHWLNPAASSRNPR